MKLSRGTIRPTKIPALARGSVFLRPDEIKALACMECLTQYVIENDVYPRKIEIGGIYERDNH